MSLRAWLFVALLIGVQSEEVIETTTVILPDIPGDVLFDPPEILRVPDSTFHIVRWNTSLHSAHHINITVKDPYVSRIVSFEEIPVLIHEGRKDDITLYGAMNISAHFIGHNYINVTVYDQFNQTLGNGSFHMSVKLSYGKINDAFAYSIGVLLALAYVNMGATLDLEVVKNIVKKPIGPLVGLFCQYGTMPLIAYALGKIFFSGNIQLQLGMFINGASPGGGNSNMWTHLLGGSLDLSIMMTFLSTIAAFAAVPLWVLSMGPLIIGPDAGFAIPYKDIAIMIISLILPCGIGVLIQKYCPKLTKFLEMTLTPFSIFNILFIFTFGIYANRFVFSIFDWRIIIAGFGLPFFGYLIGAIIAFLCRRCKRDIIAIAVETGIQNGGIAIFILKFTLPEPDGSLSTVVPAASALMNPLPLATAFIIKTLVAKVCHSSSEATEAEPNAKDAENNEIVRKSNGKLSMGDIALDSGKSTKDAIAQESAISTICSVIQDGAKSSRSSIAQDGAKSIRGSIAQDGGKSIRGSIAQDGVKSIRGSIAQDGAKSIRGSIAQDGAKSIRGSFAQDCAKSIRGSIAQDGAKYSNVTMKQGIVNPALDMKDESV